MNKSEKIREAIDNTINNFDESTLYNGRETKTTQKVLRQLSELELTQYVPENLLDVECKHYFLLNAIVDAANEGSDTEGGYEGHDGDYSINTVAASELYQALNSDEDEQNQLPYSLPSPMEWLKAEIPYQEGYLKQVQEHPERVFEHFPEELETAIKSKIETLKQVLSIFDEG